MTHDCLSSVALALVSIRWRDCRHGCFHRSHALFCLGRFLSPFVVAVSLRRFITLSRPMVCRLFAPFSATICTDLERLNHGCVVVVQSIAGGVCAPLCGGAAVGVGAEGRRQPAVGREWGSVVLRRPGRTQGAWGTQAQPRGQAVQHPGPTWGNYNIWVDIVTGKFA